MSSLLLAMAQQGAGGKGGGFGWLLPFVAIFLIMYLLMIRPQQKKHREHQQMLQTLRKGDRVVTTGGFLATVLNVKEKENIVVLRLADNVKVEIQKGAIAAIISKSE